MSVILKPRNYNEGNGCLHALIFILLKFILGTHKNTKHRKVYAHTWMLACMCALVHAFMQADRPIYVRTFRHNYHNIYIYIYIYIYIHTHTYIRTYIGQHIYILEFDRRHPVVLHQYNSILVYKHKNVYHKMTIISV